MCIIELEFRDKNQRVAYHDTKQIIQKFKVLGQPVTSEHRSKTHKCPRCDFSDNLPSEQARIAIQRLKHVMWSVEYNAEYLTPLLTILEAKFINSFFWLK